MNLLILPNWNLHGVEDHISLNHERPSTQRRVQSIIS